MIAVRRKKRKNYTSLYLDININGFRKWESLNLVLTGDKIADKAILQQAERIRAKRLIEITSDKYDLDPVSTDRDFLKYYKQIIDERPEYERRVAVYKHLEKFTKGNKLRLTFRDINESFWNRFKSYLVKEAKHSPSTIYTVQSILKAVLNRAVRDRIILKNPLNVVKERRPKSNRTYLTLEELQLLKKTPCINEEVKNAFFFACNTGFRKGDIKNLQKKNLIDGEIVTNMEKTEDAIRVPYDKKLLEYLPDLSTLDDDDFLFDLPAWSTVGNIIHQWAAGAGIKKKVTFHTSRHTFATLSLTSGTSIEVVSELLGHKNIRETQIYAKIINEKKREAIKNMPII